MWGAFCVSNPALGVRKEKSPAHVPMSERVFKASLSPPVCPCMPQCARRGGGTFFFSLFFFFFFNLRARAHNHAHFTLHKHAAAIRRCPDWEHRLVLVCFRSHHKICPICLLSLSFFFFSSLVWAPGASSVTQHRSSVRIVLNVGIVASGPGLYTHTHWITSVTLKHHHAPRFRMAIEGW